MSTRSESSCWAQAADESSGWPLRSRHARQVVSRTAYVALLGFLLHEAQLHITGDMTASGIWLVHSGEHSYRDSESEASLLVIRDHYSAGSKNRLYTSVSSHLFLLSIPIIEFESKFKQSLEDDEPL